jgi:hypothetical protein
LNTYKPPGTSFEYIKRHVPLKQFLREIFPRKKFTPKSGCYMTAITGKLLRDANGEIRFEKVFEWALLQFGEDDSEALSEFQAARMQNYTTKRVADGWTPKYYTWDKVITADHVVRFYGASLAKMLMGNCSIENSSMQYHQFKQLCQRMLWRT